MDQDISFPQQLAQTQEIQSIGAMGCMAAKYVDDPK